MNILGSLGLPFLVLQPDGQASICPALLLTSCDCAHIWSHAVGEQGGKKYNRQFPQPSCGHNFFHQEQKFMPPSLRVLGPYLSLLFSHYFYIITVEALSGGRDTR